MSVSKSLVWWYDGAVAPLHSLATAERIACPANLTTHEIGVQISDGLRCAWAMMTRPEALDLLRSLASHLDCYITTGDVMREGVMQ